MAKARAKNTAGKANSGGATGRTGQWSLASYAGAFAALVAAVGTSLLGARWWTAKDNAVVGDTAPNRTEASPGAEGLGPDVMAGQANLLSRLLELLQEVDTLQGDEHHAERLAASASVEAELENIEAKLDPSTPAGKQQLGLVSLVRSALRSDRAGETASDEDWSEEALRKKHGLVTYAAQEYWEEAYDGKRYGESFDWYGAWTSPDLQGRSLGDIARPLLPATDSRILMLGCGNSNMSALMYKEGYKNIVNIDIVESVIEQMKTRYMDLEGMEWHAMDAASLTFPSASYDVVVEKGMFDALFAGTGTKADSVLDEALRVLRPGGRLLSVSFAGDRLDRLFARDFAAPTPQLSCQIFSKLLYGDPGANKSDASNESRTFWVYSCDRL